MSVIYNIKNYGSLPYILFIAVQNSRITLDNTTLHCDTLKIQDGVEKLNWQVAVAGFAHDEECYASGTAELAGWCS